MQGPPRRAERVKQRSASDCANPGVAPESAGGRCEPHLRVPANHLPRWVPPHALLARGSVDGATNLCSPSTVAKVNYQVMRYLHFGSVEGDLQEGHCYASRAQKPHFCVKTTKNLGKFAHSDTKMAILCSKCPKTGVPDPKSAQKPRFCARNA